jgi:hypothetical protein
MKLRVGDVESLRNELSGGEVVDLGEMGEELVFEDDAELEPAGMATEELSDMDTLLDDDVEDVGTVDLEELSAGGDTGELDELEELDDLSDGDESGVRRTPAAVALAQEEEHEGAGTRFLLIATSAVLTMAIPICLAHTTGNLSEIVRAVAFWKQF